MDFYSEVQICDCLLFSVYTYSNIPLDTWSQHIVLKEHKRQKVNNKLVHKIMTFPGKGYMKEA